MKLRVQIIAILIAITGSIITLSCKKDKATVKTKTELLTTGTWRLTSYTSTPAYDWYGNGVFATDIFHAVNPCEIDGFDIYRTNGIVEINEGPLKCNSTDPQTFTATWEFTDNETKIMYDGFDEYELVELTATTLRLRQTFVENGVTYTHIETHEH